MTVKTNKISFNIKDPIIFDKVEKHIELTKEKKTDLMNRLVKEYFSSGKICEKQNKILESLENLELLVNSAAPNIQAIQKEVTQIKWLISQS